jgi:hypothetical protein
MAILTATPKPQGERDPFYLRQYFENELAPVRLANFTQEKLQLGGGPAGVLRWELILPNGNGTSGFASYVVLAKEGWAVHVDVYGPTRLAAVHEATFRKIVASIEWK